VRSRVTDSLPTRRRTLAAGQKVDLLGSRSACRSAGVLGYISNRIFTGVLPFLSVRKTQSGGGPDPQIQALAAKLSDVPSTLC
jgi:hypothetical protein